MRSFRVNNGKRDSDLNVQINLAPMIDFLVVVIAYLLVSASFYSIQFMESSFAKDSGDAAPSSEPTTLQTVAVHLLADGSIQMRIFSKEETGKNETIPSNQSNWRIDTLLEKTRQWNKERGISSIKLSSEGRVRYGQVVNIMSKLRNVVPEVSLSVQ